MKKGILNFKSFEFAIRVVNLRKYLIKNRNEFVISKQILRCGTSVGAMVREAEFSESMADFIHKLSIAQKEINETIYWLELLYKTGYLKFDQFESLNNDAIEILKLLTSSIKTSKLSLKTKN